MAYVGPETGVLATPIFAPGSPPFRGSHAMPMGRERLGFAKIVGVIRLVRLSYIQILLEEATNQTRRKTMSFRTKPATVILEDIV